MKFIVEDRVFDALPGVCFGVVIAQGVNNTADVPALSALLNQQIEAVEARFTGRSIKEDPAILPYREAFLKLDINPNKFLSSIEALFTRVGKGKGLPSINPIVDLGNAMSLKYVLPMGAHDIGQMHTNIAVRFSREGDTFLPFGETETEAVPEGELVYAVGERIRTRRWIWRQSELGKIGPDTRDIFYPIDGFADIHRDAISNATDELAALCRTALQCKDVRTAFVDRVHPEVTLA